MRRFCLFFTMFAVLFLFVSCSDISETGIVSVKFGEESSREIHGAWDENLSTEDCYWTYTAEKTQGNGAVGESTLNNASKWVERPVKTGVGLRGEAKEFSLGKWKFIVYGYKDDGYTQLVYTGMREVEFKTTSTAADKTVLFEVHGVSASSSEVFTGDKASAATKTYRNTGLLNIGEMSLTEPYGYDFMTGSTLLIELFKVAGTPETETKIASSTTTVGTTSPDSVDTIALGAFSFVSGFERDKIADGVETIRVKVTYTLPASEGGAASVIGKKDYFIPIGSGLDTLLAGTLNDIDWTPAAVITLDLGDSAASVAEISGDRQTSAVFGGSVRPFTVANGGMLDGYYTAATGGNKVFDKDGNTCASVSGYTSSTGKWIKEGNVTLYARYNYEVLNYITVGGGAYIDTGLGIKPNSGAEIKFRVSAAETGSVLFGVRDGVGDTNSTDFTFWRPGNGGASSNKPNLHFGGVGSEVADSLINSVDIVTFKNLKSYFNAKLVRGDYPALGACSAHVFIGGLNWVNGGTSIPDGLNCECTANNAHIYYYKQFEGEILVLDLVPAKRLSDNVNGMLDTLTGNFLVNPGGTNLSGTALTAGRTFR